MLDWLLVIPNAAVCGLVLSLVLTVLATVMAAIVPDMFVGSYPPDIQQRFGPMSPRAARLRPFMATMLVGAVVAVTFVGLFTLRAKSDHVSFPHALVFAVTVLAVFNVFDLLILDWLLFCTVTPRFIVLPGTEGMAGYRDYWFHLVGFFKGLGFSSAGGLLIALLWVGVQRLISS